MIPKKLKVTEICNFFRPAAFVPYVCVSFYAYLYVSFHAFFCAYFYESLNAYWSLVSYSILFIYMEIVFEFVCHETKNRIKKL